MHISKIRIENFKCFSDSFVLPLENGINILVGDNEAGKSTILEAIHLALSGIHNGRYLKNEINQYLFNNEKVAKYLASLQTESPLPPPEILIEIFITGEDLPMFEGDGNSEKKKECCVTFKIELDPALQGDYDNYVKKDVKSLPIDYYHVVWFSCAREAITTRSIPIKSALIDSSNNRYQNGSDIYINHIMRNHLTSIQKIEVSQAFRKMQENFVTDASIVNINKEILALSKKTSTDKAVKLSVDLTSKNSWENTLLTFVEDVPFQHIGKGEQALVKTKLALEHNKTKEANIILLEEPENHLSHTKLNQLIKDIKTKCDSKQIILSTHNSFVANKLGLKSLILLNNKSTIRLNDLGPDTVNFFEKITGYDTLRLILCKSAILCEGDSDELLIQKAYMKSNNGKLPIEDGIEVISVGLSFARYIEIAEKLSKRVAVVTDNDGKAEKLIEKYNTYNGDANSPIKVFFDTDNQHATLEPQLIKTNGWELVNQIIDQKYKQNGEGYKKGDDKCKSEIELLQFMSTNKTECALKFFGTSIEFKVPEYITKSITHVQV